MAEDKVDPLKIISLSRDLFFSFVPGLLSCTGRSPAAQAAGSRPGYIHLRKRTDIDNSAGEIRAPRRKDLQSERRAGGGRSGPGLVRATGMKGYGAHNKSSFICPALKPSTRVYVRGSELDRGAF